MSEDDRYIYRRKIKIEWERIKIPEGCVKCPNCDGTGEILVKHVDFAPWEHNEYWPCPVCQGKGYIPKELKDTLSQSAKTLKKLGFKLSEKETSEKC